MRENDKNSYPSLKCMTIYAFLNYYINNFIKKGVLCIHIYA